MITVIIFDVLIFLIGFIGGYLYKNGIRTKAKNLLCFIRLYISNRHIYLLICHAQKA
jgi:hypothetical protein